MGRLSGTRARLRLLFSRGAAESRMEDEIRFHIDMETERLVREGLDEREARRRALLAFGGVERTREEMREGRGLAWLSGLRLDLKLGVRMLLKYPVLTLASVLALTVAIALAVSWFQFSKNMAFPRLPLPEADRIVRVEYRDLESGEPERKSLHEFEAWRRELRSIEDLGAASPVEYTVTTQAGRFETLEGMRITASMFRVVRVQPFLGRALTEEDDRPGAAPVAVIAYSAWQRLYGGDRAAIGQTVRLGSEQATLVGVMPEGFGFPVNEEIWTPLRESAGRYGRREGPAIRMFGRLAWGATLKQAQAELETIAAAAAPRERLRPEVRRFAAANDMALGVAAFNAPFLFFLLVVGANVATLLFARTATRESEIALRSALGASRRRIVLQLAAEALVLTSAAAALALLVADRGLRWAMALFWEVQQMRPPFWWEPGLSIPGVLYVLLLALLGAAIIGGIPGLRATRRQLRPQLAQPGAGGSGMRFGSVATGVIVVQVALCVAFIPVAITNGQELLAERHGAEFPAGSFLTGRLMRQADAPAPAAGAEAGERTADPRTARLFDEVQRRLAADPAVLAATRSSRLPGFNHPIERLEVEGDSAETRNVRQVAVDPNFFDVMGARIVAGRAFTEGDVAGEGAVAIVDRDWAREKFGERSPIGRRIRYPEWAGERKDRWYEIVGVVTGMERAIGPGTSVAVYHPLRPAEQRSVEFYLRTAGRPATLAPRVQALVGAVDPDLTVSDLMPLAAVWRPVERSNVAFVAGLFVVAGIILLFALMGIYALMSFTVAQRAREIGIRAALGANPGRILAAIFSRAMMQIGLGVLIGVAVASLTVARTPGGFRLVGGVALAMAAVGLVGCVVPARRALRVQPIDALRAE
ncbi:MAG TPA: ABC transporter permease [Longimicrobiales bacterium]|nr:ABC transporter permease [Longimicrobiales bacterium]